jgi:peptide/nickel transport system substrate-binding protein
LKFFGVKYISLWLVLVLVLSACAGGAQPTASETDTVDEQPAAEAVVADEEDTTKATEGESTTKEESVAVSAYGEAPMLADMVAAGELPPVEERLPVDVQVVEVTNQIGQYGGEWNTIATGSDFGNIKMILYDPPIRWKPDYSGYEPGLAKEYSWSEDGTEVTWRFREGVKWSDGEPFTMDDLRFWWEDLALNEDYKVVQPPWWGFNSDGSPMEVTFPDDYTMVMKWDQPQWITPYIIAQGFWEWEPLMKPRHYLEQFHPDYTDGATYEELELMSKWIENPDFPVLFAWHPEEVKPGEQIRFVRNPYYWKVDPDGNQLPYIDYLVADLIEDEQVRLLSLSQGKYNASFRGIPSLNDIPFLLEHAEESDYQILEGWVSGAGANPGWLVNQDFIDKTYDNWEEIREVLRDKRFRQALSYAMDRQRILDVIYVLPVEPKSFTISPQSWHFQSEAGQEVFNEWATKYSEHDVDQANALLDEIGMQDSDGDGFRELPSGEKFTLVLDQGTWGAGQELNAKANEVYRTSLAEVGIDVLINDLVGQPDWDLRQTQGLYMLRNAGTSELDIWTYPDWVFPVRDNRAWPLQGKWRQTGGAEGEEPLPDSPAALLQALYDKGLAEPDAQKRHEIVWEAVRVHIDEGPFMLGAGGDRTSPVLIKNNFKNVPSTGILGPWAPGSPGNKHPEQFYIEQ